MRYFTAAGATPATPQALSVRLGAFDPASTSAVPGALPHPCALTLHLLLGERVVWALPGSDRESCPQLARWRAGYGERELHLPIAEVLGDSLPAGEYRIRTVLRLSGDTLALDHGRVYLARDTLPPLDHPPAVRMSAHWRRVGPDRIAAQVALRTAGERTIRLEHAAEGCSLYVHLVRIGDPASAAGTEGGCPLILVRTFVYPGHVQHWPEYPMELDLRRVLGDSMPPGDYTATLRFIYRAPHRGEFREDTAVFALDTLRIAP